MDKTFLQSAQNADGGWPYVPGAASSPEPTCYALMVAPSPDGVRWLKSRVRGDAVALDGDEEPHWTTSLAVIALRDEDEARDRLVKWLLRWEGRTMVVGEEVALDGTLRGWPWAMDTFGWVEPTSYALLALKLRGQKKHPRVAEAERFLLDRVGADGGWNCGNPKVMGLALPSFAPTTALAALALQDIGAPGALTFLDAAAKKRPSDLSLALTILCFNAFALPTGELAAALARRRRTDGSWQGQVHLTALALLALEASSGGRNVFRV